VTIGKGGIKERNIMRKSLPPKHPPIGNGTKFLCYREAWTRIEKALQQEFFLEAVAIEESIMWDRITSYLRDQGETVPDSKTFGRVIESWKKMLHNNFCDLQEQVSAWKRQRDCVIHGMVKSENIDAFLEKAKDTAEKGRDLARTIERWREKQKHSS
jgi:hypothetical protein